MCRTCTAGTGRQAVQRGCSPLQAGCDWDALIYPTKIVSCRKLGSVPDSRCPWNQYQIGAQVNSCESTTYKSRALWRVSKQIQAVRSCAIVPDGENIFKMEQVLQSQQLSLRSSPLRARRAQLHARRSYRVQAQKVRALR